MVEVEILSPVMAWSASDGRARCDYHRARVVETIGVRESDGAKATLAGEMEFFLHAEGKVDFSPGDRVLLFAHRASQRPEFAALAQRFTWYSAQGPGQEWKLIADQGDRRRRAARDWARGGNAAAQTAILLDQLKSGDRRLQEDAILEMVGRSQNPAYLASSSDRAPFLEVLEQGNLTPSHARALRVLLSRRSSAEGSADP